MTSGWISICFRHTEGRQASGRRVSMAFASQPRAFVRSEGEEEITPPCTKTRSFDSMSVAHLLQAKLDPTTVKGTDPAEASGSVSPPAPGSPTVDAAAALLTRVGSHGGGMDKAVDCLMSLAAFAGGTQPPSAKPAASERSSKKRARQSNAASHSSSAAFGEHSESTSTRRRLALRPPPSMTSQPQSSSSSAQAPLAHFAMQGVPPSQLASAPPCLSVAGLVQPVKLVSGANLQQLKLLSAAFKLCPTPTAEQLVAIAHRVDVAPEKLETWFSSRRTLEQWIGEQPHLQPADIASMFFEPDR